MSVLFVFRLAALVTPLVLGEPLLSDGLVVRLQRVPGNGTHFYVGRPEYFYWRGMERTVGLWLLVGWSTKNLAGSWPDDLSDTELTTFSTCFNNNCTSSKYLISTTSKPSPTKRQRTSLSTFSTFEVACEILFNINLFWIFNPLCRVSPWGSGDLVAGYPWVSPSRVSLCSSILPLAMSCFLAWMDRFDVCLWTRWYDMIWYDLIWYVIYIYNYIYSTYIWRYVIYTV